MHLSAIPQATETEPLKTGSHLVNKFHAALKVSEIYPTQEEVLRPFIESCLHALNAFIERQKILSFKVVRDDLHLNEDKALSASAGLTGSRYVTSQLKKKLIGKVVFKGPLSGEVLKAFLFAFNRLEAGRADNGALLNRELSDRGITSIEVGPMVTSVKKCEDPLAGREGHQDTARKTFLAMIRMTGEISGRAERAEKTLDLRRIKRLALKLIRLVAEEEPSFLGWAAARRDGRPGDHHAVNVAVYSLAIGRRLGFSRKTLKELAIAALLHEIGRPEAQASPEPPSAPLDREGNPGKEAEILCRLEPIPPLQPRTIIGLLEHLVPRDASGSAAPSRAGRPSLFGRILHIADAFDAMTSSNHPRTPGQALAAMVRDGGRRFDPILLKIFIGLLGIYPIGSLVLLDTDDLGIVIRANQDPRMMDRPRVRLIPGARQGGREEVLDLSEKNDHGGFRWNIVRAVDPSERPLGMARCLQ